MKDTRTLRGVILSGNESKKIFDSPQDNVGWIVEQFQVWSYNMDSNLYSAGKLWKGDPTAASLQNSDAWHTQAIAWSQTSGSVAESASLNIIDSDHLITNELHVVNMSAQAISYIVRLKRISITDDQEIMSIIKERAGNV
jgi:hypothetical protein